MCLYFKSMLNLAVAQINQHTDLRIDYTLEKKGRSFDNIRFTICQQQPQQLPIPFKETADNARLLAARQRLAELEIRDPRLVEEIMGDPQKVDQLFNFLHKVKTGKTTAMTNAGGLFLTMIGLRDAKSKEGNRSANARPAVDQKWSAKQST